MSKHPFITLWSSRSWNTLVHLLSDETTETLSPEISIQRVKLTLRVDLDDRSVIDSWSLSRDTLYEILDPCTEAPTCPRPSVSRLYVILRGYRL